MFSRAGVPFTGGRGPATPEAPGTGDFLLPQKLGAAGPGAAPGADPQRHRHRRAQIAEAVSHYIASAATHVQPAVCRWTCGSEAHRLLRSRTPGPPSTLQ